MADCRRRRHRRMTASATASAASSVQPPAKTARRRKSACSSAVSRSWLQAIVSRSVCCRAGASRGPPVEQAQRRRRGAPEPLQQRRGGSALIRAAASSIASGSPSSRAQIGRDGGGVVGREREVRADARRPVDEERDGRVTRQRLNPRAAASCRGPERRDRELLLARHPQRGPAVHQLGVTARDHPVRPLVVSSQPS